jgi:hypothetical protein
MQPGLSVTKTSLAKEASLKREYPPLNKVKASKPCIVVDAHGIILAWYLPGILNDSRQVGLFTLSDHSNQCDAHQNNIMLATENLYPLVKKSIGKKSETKSETGISWRIHPKNFNSGTDVPEGAVSMSPAWFQQGHEVGPLPAEFIKLIIRLFN